MPQRTQARTYTGFDHKAFEASISAALQPFIDALRQLILNILWIPFYLAGFAIIMAAFWGFAVTVFKRIGLIRVNTVYLSPIDPRNSENLNKLQVWAASSSPLWWSV